MPILLSGRNGYLRILLDLRVRDAVAQQNAIQLVSNVNGFEAHIACSHSLEFAQVIPCINQVGQVPRILGIDED